MPNFQCVTCDRWLSPRKWWHLFGRPVHDTESGECPGVTNAMVDEAIALYRPWLHPDSSEALELLREIVANHFGAGDLTAEERLMERARALLERTNP